MFPPAARVLSSENAHDGDAYHFPGLVFREADREVATADEHHDSPFAGPQTYAMCDSSRCTMTSNRCASMAEPSMCESSRESAAVGAAGAAGSSQKGSSRFALGRTDSQPLPMLPRISARDRAGSDSQSMREESAPADTRRSALSSSDSHREYQGGNGRHTFASSGPATGNDATTQQLLEMRKLIKQHLTRSHIEVVVIVEAIDPHSSNTFQVHATHSPWTLDPGPWTSPLGPWTHSPWDSRHADARLPPEEEPPPHTSLARSLQPHLGLPPTLTCARLTRGRRDTRTLRRTSHSTIPSRRA